MITDEDIKREFLAAGFTIKPGHDDLKPYVYEAARRVIALAEAAERERWREIVNQLIACHEEPTCPAIAVARDMLREALEPNPAHSIGAPIALEKKAEAEALLQAAEIARECFGRFAEDDGSNADVCFYALGQLIDWMQQQRWQAPPLVVTPNPPISRPKGRLHGWVSPLLDEGKRLWA